MRLTLISVQCCLLLSVNNGTIQKLFDNHGNNKKILQINTTNKIQKILIVMVI